MLGRSRRFAPTMWSCLAGFAEPGETIEEAVRREVLEEVGHRLRPRALFRIAAVAVPVFDHDRMPRRGACRRTIVVDRDELEDARWFDRDELALMLKRQHPQGLTTPPPVAIAHHIIRGFVEDGRDVVG